MEVAYNIVYGGVTLPWEWLPEYGLRSTLYPYYLSLPLYILKITGLDYTMAVRLCPQLAHIVLVLVGDWYFWRLGKLVVGKNATSLAAVLLIFNRPF